jgi:hypothetical protein
MAIIAITVVVLLFWPLMRPPADFGGWRCSWSELQGKYKDNPQKMNQMLEL